ncbi:alpha-amylase/4-alpha-glucanotransferase domain-containing protein [Sediminispirochaeta smaragdinae]|jgi:alpha-amylase|uniref:4-alpha-glucanotransferase n=1 Tax=Sediminispirochaeta smaragdinae (strain DSM 11293 / JCM 15392 / SEBR 4228) TaxID=573413 RepID=E1R6M3_SEDSS|nr:alpha-amylase/4-alpha-glucanotransferase domain-containing protein [Sediminispirochaeta smaragdinae]ADK81041.1 4-alpha-glucanotransferase [Sediminispirochaeta smaragdinae DSM 11293]
MKKLRLIFGVFGSKPVGTDPEQLETVYQKTYKPFLTVLYGFPKIRSCLHFSGQLFDWFEETHPEILMVISEMVKRKQLEIIGGGYYEPIFPLIPTKDRVGQIELLTTYIRKRFGKRPRGCWIPERVWEPSLASVFSSSGMEYIFLDDRHFMSAGLRGEKIYHPCITEDQGKTVRVLPLTSRLNRMIPFASPEDVYAKIGEIAASEEHEVASIMIDADMLGYVPGTEGVCEAGGWMECFLRLVDENRGVAIPVLPGQFVRSLDSLEKVYFPCTAYEEMMQWPLPPEQQMDLEFVRSRTEKDNGSIYVNGGYFRQFLTRYPESNLLYARMMYTYLLVNQVQRDRARKKSAREESWRGQCNAPYWHGRYNGVYDNHLRKAAYRSFITAEKTTRERGIFTTAIHPVDIDFDGADEYIYQGQNINAYIHRRSGMLFELDYLVSGWNYLDTMARHRERYHDDNDERLGIDNYPRRAFLDHVLYDDVTFSQFKTMQFREAADFINQRYDLDELDREHKRLYLHCGTFLHMNGVPMPLFLKKGYNFSKNSVEVEYTIENRSSVTSAFLFAPEINLSLFANAQEDAHLFLGDKGDAGDDALTEGVERGGIKEIALHDNRNHAIVSIVLDSRWALWSFPIYTIAAGLRGKRAVYQSNAFVVRKKLSLEPGESWSGIITMKIEKK